MISNTSIALTVSRSWYTFILRDDGTRLIQGWCHHCCASPDHLGHARGMLKVERESVVVIHADKWALWNAMACPLSSCLRRLPPCVRVRTRCYTGCACPKIVCPNFQVSNRHINPTTQMPSATAVVQHGDDNEIASAPNRFNVARQD